METNNVVSVKQPLALSINNQQLEEIRFFDPE